MNSVQQHSAWPIKAKQLDTLLPELQLHWIQHSALRCAQRERGNRILFSFVQPMIQLQWIDPIVDIFSEYISASCPVQCPVSAVSVILLAAFDFITFTSNCNDLIVLMEIIWLNLRWETNIFQEYGSSSNSWEDFLKAAEDWWRSGERCGANCVHTSSVNCELLR